MLENLNPAERVTSPTTVKVGVEFDGQEGWAQTPGLATEPETFDEFLRDAGIDPADIEVIPPVRTSRWQQQKDGELVWLTSYRFTFRKRKSQIDLPLLLAEAEKKSKKSKPRKADDTALVVMWSDLQVGKVDLHGGIEEMLERLEATHAKLIELVDYHKPKHCYFLDLGDTVENFENKASLHQLRTNDLSIMEQVDMATTMAWRTIRKLAELVPTVTYASVGSNHCQWRKNGQTIGKPTDDWGIFIGRQLARVASEAGVNNIKFIEPQEHDESLALDVFGDQYHVLGIVHGHQARTPGQLEEWWKKQAFGSQPVADATMLVHGHFHHLRVLELGGTQDGNSRFIVGAPTLDNGSNWFRLRAGASAPPGLGCFLLEKNKPFTGTVWKL